MSAEKLPEGRHEIGVPKPEPSGEWTAKLHQPIESYASGYEVELEHDGIAKAFARGRMSEETARSLVRWVNRGEN